MNKKKILIFVYVQYYHQFNSIILNKFLEDKEIEFELLRNYIETLNQYITYIKK